MLYDPKWEQKTKADPLTLASLIAWLERQPAEETYCYTSTGECLLAQYFTAQGFHRVSVGPFGGWGHRPEGQIYFGMKASPGFHKTAFDHPRTFGAALKRARAMVA